MIASLDTIASFQSQVHEMTTEQLREEFRSGLRITVEQLTRLAVILTELESRGEKILGVNESLLSLLRRVGKGELLAEVIVRFASTPQVMRHVGRLPIEEQQRVVESEDECERLTKPKSYSHSAGRNMVPRADGHGIESRHHILAAKLSTPKDLAELIAEMIAANPKPVDVWEGVCRHMESVLRAGEKKK